MIPIQLGRIMTIIKILWLSFLMSTSFLAQAGDGIYAWKSAVIQDKNSRDRLLSSANQYGISRIYLGLNAHQVRDDGHFSVSLRDFISLAKARNVDVWLLLGDPGWLSPDERHKLVDIVRRFEPVPFDGIMLDLEVEQIAFPVKPETLVQWVDTVEAVTHATKKPVSIASHWRWFGNDSPVCMSCEFSDIGIREISLMVYTTNIDRAVEVTQNAALPNGLKIRLAQSIEPTLEASESWAKVPPTVRKGRIYQLKRRIMDTPIDWQAYEFIDYLD